MHRARVEYDPRYLDDRVIASDGDGKRLGVNDRGVLTWVGGDQPEQDYPFLRFHDDDVARALYEALANYFGGTGHDTRALRKDYEHEKARLDKVIDHLLARPVVVADGARIYPPEAAEPVMHRRGH